MINYKKSGVNIEEGYEAVDLIKKYASKTHTKNVLNDLGSFAGLFELSEMKNPVLVSGTDGVGTKLEIAFKKSKFDTIGIDCVAMCVNDIICHGAKPLFFLDYIACGKLDKHIVSEIVKGVSDGCQKSFCSLIGGETAEMPGFYDNGKYDIAGFAVGVVEKEKIINGDKIGEGNVLIGIESSGLHSNGFSLVRYIVDNFLTENGYNKDFNGIPLWKELLKPTKIYVNLIHELVRNFPIMGISHITGGGFYENIPRITNNNIGFEIRKDRLPKKPIFEFLSSFGVSEIDMYRTFNMGIGMVICVKRADSKRIIDFINSTDENAFEIGKTVSGGKGICII